MTTPTPQPGAATSAVAAPAKPISGAALAAAVIAIARHVTGTPAGSEHQALTMLGVTAEHASNITGKPAS